MQGLTFEPDVRPDPVPNGACTRQFLGQVERSLEEVRGGELEKIALAGTWIRQAVARRSQVVRNLVGHLPPREIGLPGDPPFFTAVAHETGAEGVQWVRQKLHAGDVYLLVGYQENEDALAAAANALGVRTIFLTAKPPGSKQAHDPLGIYIDPHWPVTDGCLELSGYDVKACPLSCILGLSCYYAICAEAYRSE